MRWSYKLRLRLRSLLHRQEAEQELNEEFQFHLRCQIDEYVAKGMNPEEARHAAMRALGTVEQFKEQCRDARNVTFIDNLLQDLRFGFRSLRRSPGFSSLAVLCLTLGIGANTAVFSWIEGALLRPYPAVTHQERLLVLAGTTHGATSYEDVSWPDMADFQRNCTQIEAFIAEKIVGATLNIGDRAERAVGSMVSADYFDALGVRPVLGRGFEPGEDKGRNAHPVVVISYQFWHDRFHGDPDVIGKTQMLNGMPFTIIGVAPQGFYGTFVGYSWQFWVTASMQERFDSSGYQLDDRSARWIEGFALLKAGVTAEQAQQEVSAVAKHLETDYPATNRGRGIALVPLWKSPFNASGDLLPTLGITLAVAFFVLLIACADVSNLLLVKSFGRRHELTVRLALGAGRVRLLQQLLTEGLLLCTIATAGGLLIARWCHNLLGLLIPTRGAPIFVAGEIDWQVLAVSAGVCLLATLLCGLIPAIQTSRFDLAGTLKCESGGVVAGSRKSSLRSGLVLLQVSLSFILLVGAGLVLQSLQAIRTSSPGFSTQNVLVTAVNLLAAGYDQQRARNFQDQLLDRVQAISGVESAAYARITPFSYRPYTSSPIVVDGYQPASDEQPTIDYNEVSPDYFTTMGIPLLSGREFGRADDENAPPVAIVNETMAAKYWRAQDPVGKRVQVGGRWMRVVGVAKLAKYRNMLETPLPFLYVPLRQNFSTQVGINLRTQQDSGTIANALSREIHALDPDLALYQLITLREQVDQQASAQNIAATMLGVFGGLALLLAAIGLYGVMSYAVSQSTRELGLRMALGASASNLLRMVMSHGMVLTTCGVALGAAAALALTRLLGYLLYQVSPHDPFAFASAFAVMAIVSLVACFVPAWRAAQIDPVRALRD